MNNFYICLKKFIYCILTIISFGLIKSPKDNERINFRNIISRFINLKPTSKLNKTNNYLQVLNDSYRNNKKKIPAKKYNNNFQHFDSLEELKNEEENEEEEKNFDNKKKNKVSETQFLNKVVNKINNGNNSKRNFKITFLENPQFIKIGDKQLPSIHLKLNDYQTKNEDYLEKISYSEYSNYLKQKNCERVFKGKISKNQFFRKKCRNRPFFNPSNLTIIYENIGY